MALRLLLASTLAAAATAMSPWSASADPSSPEPGCPVTDPPVINRCGWEATPAPAPPPPGVKVYLCKDDSYTFTQSPKRGATCAENGGVKKWIAG